MDHGEINEKEIIERYLLGKLNSFETEAFEEHLFFCPQCMEELEQYRKIIDAIRISAEKSMIGNERTFNVPSRKKTRIYYLYATVAAAAVIASIAFIIIPKLYQKQTESKLLKDLSYNYIIKRTRPVFIPGEFIVKSKKYITVPDTVNEKHNDSKVAFAENPKLDSAINDELAYIEIRGIQLPGLAETSPANGTELKSGEVIHFKWMSNYNDMIYTLIVYNNIGNEIHITDKIKGVKDLFEYQFSTTSLKPGLYYWRILPLENKEYPHTGKFKIK
jgi:hypothetical protein